MASSVNALQGVSYKSYVAVREIGPLGMITLRGSPIDLANPLQVNLGLRLPGPRKIETAGAKSAGWMSPDEFMVILPHHEVDRTLAALHKDLKGKYFLAVDVSDARAVFTICGARAREVLAKLCPVDLSPAAFQPGDLRRTRAAQVAAAFWISGPEEFTLVGFRSVAQYIFALLQASAMPGGEVGLY